MAHRVTSSMSSRQLVGGAATLAVSPTRAAELPAEAPALVGTDDATAPTQPMHRHEHEEHGKTPAGVFGDL